MTLDRKEKKTSKIKKFFKKLSSTKKDSGKYDNKDSIIRHDRLPSTDSESNRLFAASGYDLRTRRRSDGTISIYSVNEVNDLTQATPLTKRRLFAINLSFMKKGRRQRSNTTLHNTSNDSAIDKPSDTIKALCSPYATRRNRLMPITPYGRRASESTVYKIQHNIDLNTTMTATPFLRHNTAKTSTPSCPSTKKYRAPQPPLNIPPAVSPTSALTEKTILTPLALAPVPNRPLVIPKVRGSRCSASTSSSGDEADYINYPFSKSNVQAPLKPTRNSSKESKG